MTTEVSVISQVRELANVAPTTNAITVLPFAKYNNPTPLIPPDPLRASYLITLDSTAASYIRVGGATVNDDGGNNIVGHQIMPGGSYEMKDHTGQLFAVADPKQTSGIVAQVSTFPASATIRTIPR